MSDTEILNTLQALLEEHFNSGGLGVDFTLGAMSFTIHAPPAMHVPRAAAAIQSGPMPDLRDLLEVALDRHLVRLVTNKLMEAGRAA